MAEWWVAEWKVAEWRVTEWKVAEWRVDDHNLFDNTSTQTFSSEMLQGTTVLIVMHAVPVRVTCVGASIGLICYIIYVTFCMQELRAHFYVTTAYTMPTTAC